MSSQLMIQLTLTDPPALVELCRDRWRDCCRYQVRSLFHSWLMVDHDHVDTSALVHPKRHPSSSRPERLSTNTKKAVSTG